MVCSEFHPPQEWPWQEASSVFISQLGKNWFIENLRIYPRADIWGNSRELHNSLLHAEISHFNNYPVLKSRILESF